MVAVKYMVVQHAPLFAFLDLADQITASILYIFV